MFRYLASLFILFIIFFLYVHVIKLKTDNNHLNIIQVHDPDPDLAYELLSHNQPIILQKELAFWKDFNKLLGKSLATIKQSISEHPQIDYSTSIKMNLEPYNLPLSYDWLIDIRQVSLDDSNGIFFIKQTNYLQVFGCVTGQFRIIITPPDQSPKLIPFINNVSSVDSSKLLDSQPMELNYIEIIIRQSNLIYIPYGWHYFIYNPAASNTESSSECVIVDCINKSILNLF
jgi:hypothetical protein